MQLLPLLFITCLVAFSVAEPLYRVLSSDDGGYLVKRAAKVRELLGKRANAWDLYPSKRARELFGKRSFATEKRKPRELFGKRSSPDFVDAQDEEAGNLDYVYDEELLRALSGLKRERRARVRELLG